MNETKTPLQLLTETLAAMTERAMKAEAERDEANTKRLEWYKSWERKDHEHKQTQAALASEIREHEKTKAELEEMSNALNALLNEYELTEEAPNSSPTP